MEARRYCLRFNQPFREKTTGLETGKFDFQIYTDWNRIRITRILNNHCCTESKQPDALACRMPKAKGQRL